uniref:MBD domain-containing protein n=1 Tax=Strigamia maritima TaxID=126957 RepID=T1JKH4_STRMM
MQSSFGRPNMADYQTKSQIAVENSSFETEEIRKDVITDTMEEASGIIITPQSSSDGNKDEFINEEMKIDEQEMKIDEQEMKIDEQEMKIDEQEMKIHEQELENVKKRKNEEKSDTETDTLKSDQVPSELPMDIGDGVPMVEDPRLPEGWSRKVVQRQTGKSAGKFDVYIYSPDGKKFRSRFELANYIVKNNLSLDIKQFDFSVRGKAKVDALPSGPRVPRPKKPSVKKPKENTTQKTKKSDLPKKSTQSKQRLLIKLNFQVPKKRCTTTDSSSPALDQPSHSGVASKKTERKTRRVQTTGKEKVSTLAKGESESCRSVFKVE